MGWGLNEVLIFFLMTVYFSVTGTIAKNRNPKFWVLVCFLVSMFIIF